MTTKPTLCLDFDGVIHSYTSSWQGASEIPDPPVPGAMSFIMNAYDHFTIAIFSSRSHQRGGKRAMIRWLQKHFIEHWAADKTRAYDVLAAIQWPDNKPAAFVTIDDRAMMFTGEWPPMAELIAFKPWNKRNPTLGALGTFSQGRRNDDDEGDLRLAVSSEPGMVRVDFGKRVAWVGFDPTGAENFANVLLKHAASARARKK